MDFLINRYRNLTVLVLVIICQLLLLAYQVKGNQDVRLIRVWAVTAVTPLAHVLEIVRRNTIGLAEDYFVLINVRTDNERLKDEVGRLKMENQFLKTELRTAERARAIQAFQSRTPSRTIAARIIGNGTGANAKVVFVDRGSVNGVMRGMAVVTPDGIVGKVLGAYPTASQVLLITDPTFAAGVVSDKNRTHGTLKGLGQSKCLVDYIANEEKVEVGEKFYTSGDDRVFPKGFPVGTATVVRPGKGNFKEVYLVPSGFHNGLEEVLIVLEGVHQQVPEAPPAVSEDYHVLPAPPTPAIAAPAKPPVIGTEADRLRARYKQIGEAQGHTFGEGLPGSKPPNFNLDPKKVQPAVTPAAPVRGATPASPVNPNPVAPATGASAAQRVESRPGPAPVAPPPAATKPKPAVQAAGSPATGAAGARVAGPDTPAATPKITPKPAAALAVDGAPAPSQPAPSKPKPPPADSPRQ